MRIGATVAGRIGAVAAVGFLATALVVALPTLHLAYEAPGLHLVLEAADGVIGAVVAYLFLGRLRARRQWSDLAVVVGLVISAASNLFLATLPSLEGSPRSVQVDQWAPMITRVVGALVLAASPFLRGRLVRDPLRAGRRAVAAALLLVACTGVTVFTLAPYLPQAFEPGLDPALSFRPLLDMHAAVAVLQTVTLAAFVVAASGFTRLAARLQDEFLGFLAAGLTLGAFARVHYLLFPSLYTRWVYSGDVLRLAFWLVLLWGGAREVRRYWTRLAESAVLEERRRIARDLHDGVAQELAYIVSKSNSLARNDDADLRWIANAAERALYESRRAVTLLGQAPDLPLPVLLARAAEEVAARHQVVVRQSGAGFPVTWQEREALVRIVREAVNNAVRHGAARRVVVELEHAPSRLVRVRDDGMGFRTSEVAEGGFGLTSMAERAEGLGGRFRVHSSLGQGTEIEVVLP